MAQDDKPGALGSNAGLGAGAEARCCQHCDDGDGNCVFPYYGVAPHIHADTGRESHLDPLALIGSTRTLPRDQWGPNFREDPDSPGEGVYMRCPACGRGEPEAPNDRSQPDTTALQEQR